MLENILHTNENRQTSHKTQYFNYIQEKTRIVCVHKILFFLIYLNIHVIFAPFNDKILVKNGSCLPVLNKTDMDKTISLLFRAIFRICINKE